MNSIENRKKSFINKANKLYNFKYDYSNIIYVDATSKVEIICPIHGPFFQTPSNHTHVKKYECFHCGKEKAKNYFTLKQDEILDRLIKLNLTNYRYDLIDYKNWRMPLLFVCDIHGKFHKRFYSFINGDRCNKCSDKINGIYNEKYFKKNTTKKNESAYLYFIELLIENKKYLKIGITIDESSIRHRYKKYNYKEIKIIKSNLYNCFKTEQHILQKFRNEEKYEKEFSGRTECFKYKGYIQKQILEILNEKI